MYNTDLHKKERYLQNVTGGVLITEHTYQGQNAKTLYLQLTIWQTSELKNTKFFKMLLKLIKYGKQIWVLFINKLHNGEKSEKMHCVDSCFQFPYDK